MTGSGRIITEAQDAGLEVLHEENLRPRSTPGCAVQDRRRRTRR
jgi:hypothetical protein